MRGTSWDKQIWLNIYNNNNNKQGNKPNREPVHFCSPPTSSNLMMHLWFVTIKCWLKNYQINAHNFTKYTWKVHKNRVTIPINGHSWLLINDLIFGNYIYSTGTLLGVAFFLICLMAKTRKASNSKIKNHNYNHKHKHVTELLEVCFSYLYLLHTT